MVTPPMFFKDIKDTVIGQDTIIFACGLRCYKHTLKQSIGDEDTNNNRPVGKFWDNDRVDDGPSSMDILLEWITDSVNAEKYFGAKDTSDSMGCPISVLFFPKKIS